MIVLGIDSGSKITGWGVVHRIGQRCEHIASGIREASGPLHARLHEMNAEIRYRIGKHEPEVVGIEEPWIPRAAKEDGRKTGGLQTAIITIKAHGACVCAVKGIIRCRTYQPGTVKKAITGSGRANKEQVRRAVSKIFKLDHRPHEDQADALAVAYCCAMEGGLQLSMVERVSRW